MRIYLDNCCFNRPFDDQHQVRVRIEAEAKLFIQERIIGGELEMAWSYILDFENSRNPFPERQKAIALWRKMAVVDVVESDSVLAKASELESSGVAGKDALHVACALEARCSHFLTTDEPLRKRLWDFSAVVVLNPVDFLHVLEDTQ